MGNLKTNCSAKKLHLSILEFGLEMLVASCIVAKVYWKISFNSFIFLMIFLKKLYYLALCKNDQIQVSEYLEKKRKKQ